MPLSTLNKIFLRHRLYYVPSNLPLGTFCVFLLYAFEYLTNFFEFAILRHLFIQLFHSLTTFFADSSVCYIGSTPPIKERKKEKEAITTVSVFHGSCFITGSALSIQGNFFNPFHARDLFLYLLKTCFQGV